MARLTQGELEIMRILWDRGELKPAEILAQFPRKITNPSLRSYLAILLEKGHLVRRRVGKAFYYRAKTRRESTFKSMLRDLARICCDGSVQGLLCQLIRMEKLSDADLLTLKRLSEEGRGPAPPASAAKVGRDQRAPASAGPPLPDSPDHGPAVAGGELAPPYNSRGSAPKAGSARNPGAPPQEEKQP